MDNFETSMSSRCDTVCLHLPTTQSFQRNNEMTNALKQSTTTELKTPSHKAQTPERGKPNTVCRLAGSLSE